MSLHRQQLIKTIERGKLNSFFILLNERSRSSCTRQKNMAQLVARLKIRYWPSLKETYLKKKEKSMGLLDTIKAKSQAADSMRS